MTDKPPFKLLSFSHLDDKKKENTDKLLKEFVDNVAPSSKYIVLIADGTVYSIGLSDLETIGVLETAKVMFLPSYDEDEEEDL